MLELIATLILFGSLFGIGVILFRKIPLLVELPEKIEEIPKENFWLKLKKKFQNNTVFKSLKAIFSEIFLQKILSKIRVLALKVESQIALWLQKLREKAKKKKVEENDDYWKNLKKSVNQENKKLPA